MSSPASSTNAPGDRVQCSLYKLPPEIRKMIFTCIGYNSITEPKWNSRIKKYLYLCNSPYYFHRWHHNSAGSWAILLNPSSSGSETYNGGGLTPFEFVLFQSEKSLYLECFQTRLSLSTLVLPPILLTYGKTRSAQRFKIDIILPLLAHIRHVRYMHPCDHEPEGHIFGKRRKHPLPTFTEVAKFLAPAVHQNQKKFQLELWGMNDDSYNWPCISLDIKEADEICKEILGLEVVQNSPLRPRTYLTSNSPKSVPTRDLV